MRPIILLLIIITIAISVRIDLTTGTIPEKSTKEKSLQEELTENNEEMPLTISPLPFQEVMVEPGQTVYGVTQQLHDASNFAIPLGDVLFDFESLNPGISADKLIAGEVYKFPLYEQTPIE
ncbi:hypothetical protein ACM26V_24405 [Salipaludibacillus sp. HK11]|uniref:hypothetical protein n=1 Tax=Salipaludibacillus sp. HK11 TaxID=3394320 RepID=UPI0039FBD669